MAPGDYQIMLGGGDDDPSSSHSQEAQQDASPGNCHVLLSKILGDAEKWPLVCKLPEDAAQLMANYLDTVARDVNALEVHERRRALALLYKLAKSAQVFPQCYQLMEVDFCKEPENFGGFADIYKGKYKDQAVCVKAFRTRKHYIRACASELTLWAHLHHQNILPFYGVYSLGIAPCVISPWMEKGNIRDFLKQFPDKPRMPFISDVLSGLSYLHKLQIVHSDLKAENILVSDSDHALLTDFGLSSISANSQQVFASSNGGTPRWMAPELLTARSKVQATKSCDVWSFACLCYEILTDEVPFYQYDDHQMVCVMIAKEIPIRPQSDTAAGCEGISDQMWALLVGCWDYEPKNRPTCEVLEESIVKMRFRDDRPRVAPAGGGRALSEPQREFLGTQLDYTHLQEILLSANTSVASPPSTGECILHAIPAAKPADHWASGPQDQTPAQSESMSEYFSAWSVLSSCSDDTIVGTSARGTGGPEMWYSRPNPNQGDNEKLFGHPHQVKIEELNEADRVIVLMGPTGSGKSSFVGTAAGAYKGAGQNMESCTSGINAIRIRTPISKGDIGVVLVDTPGFNNAQKSDYQVLCLISEWLKEAGHKNIPLDGILYFHRISDNRVAGTTLRNLAVFKKICGPQACSRVVVVTTMWDELGDEEIGYRREADLKSGLFASLIKQGSSTERYKNTEESAWQILQCFIGTDKPRKPLIVQLQKDMVKYNRSLPSTNAGQELLIQINELDKKRKLLMSTLKKQINKKGAGEDDIKMFELEYHKLERECKAAMQELRELKVPGFRGFLKPLSATTRYLGSRP